MKLRKKESLLKPIVRDFKFEKGSIFEIKTKGPSWRYSYCRSLGFPEFQPNQALFGFLDRGMEECGDGYVSVDTISITAARRLLVKDNLKEGKNIGCEKDVVRVNRRGQYGPSHIPDVGDMAMLPKALKLAAMWMLEDTVDEEYSDKEKKNCLITHEWLRYFVDREPTVPLIQEYCILGEGIHELQYNSFSDAFKVFVVEGNIDVSSLGIKWEMHTQMFADGRKWSLKFNIVKCENKRVQSRIVVWNCRGMARPSFIPNIKDILEFHVPKVVLLTETRVSSYFSSQITRHLNMMDHWGANADRYVAGLTVLKRKGESRIHGNELEKNGSMGNYTTTGIL